MKTILLITTLISTLALAEEAPSAVQATPTPAVVTNSVSTLNTSWVDQKIEEIKPQRHGLNKATLATLKSPFVIIKPEPKDGKGVKGGAIKQSPTNANGILPSKMKRDMSKEPLTLQIVLNSSALVNGKWLKVDDSFRGYKLTQIQRNHVVLERKNKKVKLFIAQKSKNINISTK